MSRCVPKKVQFVTLCTNGVEKEKYVARNILPLSFEEEEKQNISFNAKLTNETELKGQTFLKPLSIKTP